MAMKARIQAEISNNNTIILNGKKLEFIFVVVTTILLGNLSYRL
jgi:hypothetical protein